MELDKDEIVLLKEAISETQKLIDDNIDKQQALMLDIECLECSAEAEDELDETKVITRKKELQLELNDLIRAKSRSELIILGYRQQIQDIKYLTSAKGKNDYVRRIAMSISETLYKETVSAGGFDSFIKKLKNIFDK